MLIRKGKFATKTSNVSINKQRNQKLENMVIGMFIQENFIPRVQTNAKPNCCQINYRKSHSLLELLTLASKECWVYSTGNLSTVKSFER